MEFDAKRFLKLAGISDDAPAERLGSSTPQPRSASRTLVESARRPAMSSDEQKLRSLIRREARKMISERAMRVSSPNVDRVQQRKSLVEAITLGFAGIGFGSNRGVLGGPMTSASRFASLYEAEGPEDHEGKLEMHEDDSYNESPDPDLEEADEAWEGSSDDDDRMMRGGG